MVYIGTLIGGNITIGTGGGGSSGHPGTWYKYQGDTEWRTVSISGAINDNGEGGPTQQIPDVREVVELEVGTDVTSIGGFAFYECLSLTSVTIGNNVTSIGS
jgi:hypothetical protein